MNDVSTNDGEGKVGYPAPGHTDPCLTDEQRANCATLAAYLRTLPVDYPDFEMRSFTQDGRGATWDRAHKARCGTAACAAGHGPIAGVKPERGEDWDDYSHRAFVDYTPGWKWCFSGEWSLTDNTAHGAAARIELMLEKGVPDDAYAQMYDCTPLSYTVEASR